MLLEVLRECSCSEMSENQVEYVPSVESGEYVPSDKLLNRIISLSLPESFSSSSSQMPALFSLQSFAPSANMSYSSPFNLPWPRDFLSGMHFFTLEPKHGFRQISTSS